MNLIDKDVYLKNVKIGNEEYNKVKDFHDLNMLNGGIKPFKDLSLEYTERGEIKPFKDYVLSNEK